MTTDVPFAADAEEAAFRAFVRAPTEDTTEFEDPLFARCADAIRSVGTLHGASTLDVAILIRHVIRRASERDGAPYELHVNDALGPTLADWEQVGIGFLQGGTTLLLRAAPWMPEWLPDASVPVDGCAVAGTYVGARARYDSLQGDPAFVEATGYDTYRTSGQRAATRAAISMPDDGTLIALLPTGSGKTEVAVTLAHLARRQSTLVVVPTVALAYDFERRFRAIFGRLNPRVKPDELAFAWTGETDSTGRDSFRSLLIAGKLPLLITSPESMSGALLHALRAAAEGGRIRSLVVDEAHLVTQWGRDFRPEFRQLSSLRRDLLTRSISAGHGGFRTLLFSATLGRAELEDLTNLFGGPGPVALVAANALRPEPEYWIASPTDDEQRADRVVEAVKRLPRPLLLYVTAPDAAERWERRLRAEGFRRVAIVTGRTVGQDRRDVLAGLRAGLGLVSSYDVVVATSAFGLGIDNDQIRSVVHACLPETVDRWYQEVGRAGRDAHASCAVLVPGWGDEDEAASLGVKMLKPDNAERRWNAMWGQRRTKDGHNYVDLHSTPPNVGAGSYNRRWNAQVLKGLEELNRVRRSQLSIGEAAALELPIGDADEPHEWERVELRELDVHEPDFFATIWEPWRLQLMSDSHLALEGIKAVLQPAAPVCRLLAKAYSPGPTIQAQFGVAADFVEPLAECGRCPGCRSRNIKPPEDPPPRIPSHWTVNDEPAPAFEALMAAAPTAERLAVLLADEPVDDARAVAKELAQSGVRFFAGFEPVFGRGGPPWWFLDDCEVGPDEVPPVPGLIIPPSGEAISQAWLVANMRPSDAHGRPVPLVFLVRPGTLVGAKRMPVEQLPVLSFDTAMATLRLAAR